MRSASFVVGKCYWHVLICLALPCLLSASAVDAFFSTGTGTGIDCLGIIGREREREKEREKSSSGELDGKGNPFYSKI